MTDADIGETKECQDWVREHPVPNTLALKHTAGNAYALTGDGSLTIKAGRGITIGISAIAGELNVAAYQGDGEPHYGLISVSYEKEKETR